MPIPHFIPWIYRVEFVGKRWVRKWRVIYLSAAAYQNFWGEQVRRGIHQNPRAGELLSMQASEFVLITPVASEMYWGLWLFKLVEWFYKPS